MFLKTTVITVDNAGKIERRAGEVPAIVGCPALRLTLPANADRYLTVRLLRSLADELEAMP